MKILFLYDFPLWGSGSATYLRDLISELVKLNHKIGIVAPDERRFLEEKIKQYKVPLPQVPVFAGHPELKGSKRYSELSEREITEIYKNFLDTSLEAVSNFGPDLIHVNHLFLISWVARYIKALKGIRYIITCHGSDLYAILKDKRYFSLTIDAVNGAKAIIANSGDTRIKFLNAFGKHLEKRVKVIPGGVNLTTFPPKKENHQSALNEKYNLKDKKLVLFVGRLISHKGAKYLVRAAKKISCEIFIIGEGPEKEYLASLVAKKKLANVHLLGYVPDHELTEFYYRADIFVAPSVWDEPLGLTIVEAMAASTPVIATRKGGIPLLVKEGYNGFFVKARSSKEIAEACNKLLENDELRKKMGENARRTIEEKFTWKIIAKKFDRLYKKIFKKLQVAKR